MRKLILLFCLHILLFQGILSAQVQLTVELQPDDSTYVVKLTPDASYALPLNTTNNAQITFVTPTGGLQVDGVTNIRGLWSSGTTILAPDENPSKDYLMFTLQSGTTDIPYVAGEEVELFSFKNTGTCTGALEFVTTDDPFFPPNSQNLNIGNQISVLGAGFINAFSGVYGTVANCLGSETPVDTTVTQDIISIGEVITNNPSDCGLTDGSIEITATHQDGNILQYSVDGGITWLDNNIITGLQSGVSYNIQVRDNLGLNFAEHGIEILMSPIVAEVTQIIVTTTDCDTATGSILIEAVNVISDGTLRFTIDDGENWVSDVGSFKNLPAGTYQVLISADGAECIDDLEPITIRAEGCTDDGTINPNILDTLRLSALVNTTFLEQCLVDSTTLAAAAFTIEECNIPTNGFLLLHDNSCFTYSPSMDFIGQDSFCLVLCSPSLCDTTYVIVDIVSEEEGEGGDSGAGMGEEEEDEEGPEGSITDFDWSNGTFPSDVTCSFAYLLEATDSVFTISILSDTSFAPPFNITSTAQITLKVPTGDFEITEFTNLIDGVVFSPNSRTNAPAEAPTFDYLSFGLDTRGTQNIRYEKGAKIPLFSFKNSGSCGEKPVLLMDNATDPFFPPNSANANVSQQLTISGLGGSGTELCIGSVNITDCGNTVVPIDSMAIDTTMMDSIPMDSISIPMDTMMVDSTDTGEEEEEGPELEDIVRDTAVISIPIDARTSICLDSLIDIQPIGAAFSCTLAGNLIVTTRDNSGCIDIEPRATFDDSEFVCVIHCDTAMVCDTTIINICPKVSLVDDLSICSGDSISLSPLGGSGLYQWTTTDSISCDTCKNITVSPDTSSSYIITNTTPSGCISSDTIAVTVENGPIINNVLFNPPTDCKEDGFITIQLATTLEGVSYSINNGQTFQDSTQFNNLAQGTYQVVVTQSNTDCKARWPDPVELRGENGVTIENVAITHPSACKETLGSIMIMSVADTSLVIEYSINNGTTWSKQAFFDSLAAGTYEVVTRIEGDTCLIAYQNNPIELAEPAALSIIAGLADRTFCDVEDKTIRLSISETISDFKIEGGDFIDAVIQDSLFSFKAVTSQDTSNYAITLTGVGGCNVVGDIQVRTRTCEALPSCGLFNGLDTLRAVIEDSMAVLCIPISEVDLAEFDFIKEGISYEMTFGECMEGSIFYSLNIADLGLAPYTLRQWIVNGDTLQDFQFTDIQTLVNRLNEFDQLTNWIIVEDLGFTGISGDNQYGPLIIQSASNTTLELQLSTMSSNFQSLIFEGSGTQVFLLRDTVMRCEDSLIIKINDAVVEEEMPGDSMDVVDNTRPLDTLKLSTTVNTTLMNQCLTNSSTIIDSISIDDCGTPKNGFLLLQENYCFNYTPNTDFVGKDSFCLVVCSPSLCDTTYVLVETTSSDLEVYTGFSPNGDGMNDVFTIKNLDSYPENSLEIFNRWGNRVYRKENYTNDWDGSYDNILLPDGIYFYILKAKATVNGKQEIRSGYVEMIR